MLKKIIPFAVILTAISACGALSFAEVVDKIAIVVNDEMITDGEIQRVIQPIYEKYKTMYSGPKLIEKLEEMKQKIAEQMIDDKLILCEAKRLNVEVDEKEIDKKVDDVIKRMGSRDLFERGLAQQHLTTKDLRMKYKEQLITKKLVDQKIGSRIMITPVEIANYYSKNSAEFTQPEEVKLWNIFIPLKDTADAQKSASLAKDISKRLKEGCDFAGLAKLYSQGPNASEGGPMGYVRRGYLLPEIDKVVFNMKDGEISGIVQTGVGYHIFKVEERRLARTLSIAEAKRDIEEAIFRQKVSEKLKGWVDSLKKNAYIAFK